MRRRPKAKAPAVASYLATGRWPTFDPMDWEGATMWARWEQWYLAQTWATDLGPELWTAWNDYAASVQPPMVPQDWIDTVGVDVSRGGHLVKDRRKV